MSDTTGENTFGLPSVPFVIDDSTEKLISRRPPRASTPKVNESKKSQSDHEEPCSSVQKLVSIKVTWAEHMNENTDPNVFDELTGNVEQYCQDQGFESQYDEIEWNIEFYDFVGPQDRVEGFICGLKVLFEEYIKKDSWEFSEKEYDSDMEDDEYDDDDDGLSASLDGETGMGDLRLDDNNEKQDDKNTNEEEEEEDGEDEEDE